jgi:hypothetical protein
VLRYVEPRSGPIMGLPVRVIQDDETGVVLYLAQGTDVRWPYVDGRRSREATLERRFTAKKEHGPHIWHENYVLFVFPPVRAHGLWLFFEPGGTFRGRYVNLQAPFQRTSIGFDSRDHTLDIWVAADGAYRWKDEDELAVAVDLGHHPSSEAAAFRAEGERVLAEWPFPTGWEDFRPDPAWPVPALPAGWDRV